MSFISSSASSTWRRTPASGILRQRQQGRNGRQELRRAELARGLCPPARIGVLEVVNQAVRGHLAHGLRAGGARARCGAERQYNRKNGRQPPGFHFKTHSLLLEKVRAIPELLLPVPGAGFAWRLLRRRPGGVGRARNREENLEKCTTAGRGASNRSSWSIINVPSGGPSCVVRSPWPSPPSSGALGVVSRRAALEQGSSRHRRPLSSQRHQRRGAQEVLGGHARRDGGEVRRAGRHPVS